MDAPPPRSDLIKRWFVETTVGRLEPAPPNTIEEQTPLRKAVDLLAERRAGSLLLVDAQGALSGIVSERDIVRKIDFKKEVAWTMPIRDLAALNPVTTQASSSLARVLNEMAIGGFRNMPVVRSDRRPAGSISVTDILRFILKRQSQVAPELLDRSPIKQFFEQSLDSFHSGPLTTTPSDGTALMVVQAMQSSRTGALPVIDPSSRALVGIVSERDIIGRVLTRPIGLNGVPTSEIMTPNPTTLKPGDRAGRAVELMGEGGFRHLPTVDAAQRVTGMVSVKDIFALLAKVIVRVLQ